MTRVLDLIERHWRKAQRKWKKGSQLRDSGAANYDAFMHGEAVGQTKAYQHCAQWIKEYLRSEDETVTDYKELEDEIDRVIDDLEGVAEKSSNGELIAHLTPIEHLKDFARHFYELGVKARKEDQYESTR